MATAVKTKTRQPTAVVPKDLDEANDFITQIAGAKQAVADIEANLSNEVEALKTEAEINARDYQAEIQRLLEGLFVFAEANRRRLTEDSKKKTIEVPAGTFGWRLTPISISIRQADDVIAALKKLGLKRFIRVKEEPNKEAMRREPEAVAGIKGIAIKGQDEEFFARPQKAELEIVSDVAKLKKSCAA